MKKILAYTFAAVLLGVGMMLAPFTLFAIEMSANGMDTQAERSYSSPTEYLQGASSKIEQTYGIEPITRPADIMFIAFLPVVSLLIALGVTSYFKRKTFSSLP
jgi:hypothetical protein